MTTLDTPITGQDLPWHLRENRAPVNDEVTLTELEVRGSIPADLKGRYLRNGANPQTGQSEHWFLGDGMIHGIELADGKANWYRNRYVRTPMFANPGVERMDLYLNPETIQFNFEVGVANTHVIGHAGRIFALEEGSFPYELNCNLDTVGVHTFDGKLTTAMTAHPKICPETGELLFFGYSSLPPYLTYHRVSAAGELLQSTEITVGGPTMMHDFTVSRYMFHSLNAHDEGDETVIRGCRINEIWRESADIGDPDSATAEDMPKMWEWRLNRATGAVSESQLDDRPSEFPQVPDAYVGLASRYGYSMSTTLDGDAGEIFKYDLDNGAARTSHRYPRGQTPGEARFVAAEKGASEDDGYLMTFVHDENTNTSHLSILDASDVAAEPLAEVHLPRRVPAGFHGSWIAD